MPKEKTFTSIGLMKQNKEYEMSKIEKCFPYFKWKPGNFTWLKSPDSQRFSRQGAGELDTFNQSNCWRIHTYSKELGGNDKNNPAEVDFIDGTIGAGYYEVASDRTIINNDFKHFRFEVGKENIELHMATIALNNL